MKELTKWGSDDTRYVPEVRFPTGNLHPHCGESPSDGSRDHQSDKLDPPRMLQEPDEDITPLDVPTDPPTVMQGPMTRARMRQLNLEVSSFLNDPFHTFENRLLPNDVILLRNIGEGHEQLRGCGGGDDDQQSEA